MISKVVLTVIVVSAINLLAKRYPAMGGYVAVLPIITFLSLITLSIDQQSNANVSSFLTGAISGIALTSLSLILMLLLVRSGMAVTQTVLVGIGIWAVAMVAGSQLFA